MRNFRNFKEAYEEIEREIRHNGLVTHVETVQDKDVKGNDDYSTKELLGYSFMVRDISDKDEWIKSLGKNLEWCEKDFEERVSNARINPGEAWKMRPEWAEFLHDGEFAYSYNERIREQLDETINLLNKNPNTRQAIVTIYDQHYDKKNRSGKARIPCTMYYQFFIREGKMHVIYNIRSNDFYTHMPYDLWHAAQLLRYVAAQNDHVNGEVGDLMYFCGSLHAFKKDNKEIF